MLGKLLKYEFKSTSRVMWFLYGGLLVIAALLGTVIRFSVMGNQATFTGYSLYVEDGKNPLIATMLIALITIYGLVMQAIYIMTYIMIILRFNRNLLGGEGYLMHTLPVKTVDLVSSKFITACIWVAIGTASAILSIIVLGFTSGMFGYIVRENLWPQMWESISSVIGTSFWLFIITLILSVLSGILLFYVSMAIGNLANRNKFLYSVLAYIGIQIIITIVTVVLVTMGGGAFSENYSSDFFSAFFNKSMIETIILNLVVGVGAFFGTTYLLNKKLNLA